MQNGGGLEEIPTLLFNRLLMTQREVNVVSDSNVYSVSEYVDLIKKTTQEMNPHMWLYRGHQGIYELRPSIYRGPIGEREYDLYHGMIARCSNYFKGMTPLDKLVMMQHYGLKTRLLDLTTSSLTALYFACEDYGEEGPEQGEVFVFKTDYNEIVYAESDRALMLSCIPMLRTEEREELYQEANKYKKHSGANKKYAFPKKPNHYYQNEIVEKFFKIIKSEKFSFDRNINPNDLISSFYVQPNKINNRIMRQDGAFIICGLYSDSQEVSKDLEKKVYKKIRINNKKEILNELNSMGINQATMFPEMEAVALYLQREDLYY